MKTLGGMSLLWKNIEDISDEKITRYKII